jgi:hypothetical protein
MANRVTAIIDKPNQDGDNVIEITLGDGSTFSAVIDLAAAQVLVEILQQRLVRWGHESARNLRFPEYEIIDANVLHQGPAAQLTLTTTQIGAVALLMSDDVLRKTRHELDRVLTYRSGPQKMQ